MSLINVIFDDNHFLLNPKHIVSINIDWPNLVLEISLRNKKIITASYKNEDDFDNALLNIEEGFEAYYDSYE